MTEEISRILSWPATHLANYPDELNAVYIRLSARMHRGSEEAYATGRGLALATYNRRWRRACKIIAESLTQAERVRFLSQRKLIHGLDSEN